MHIGILATGAPPGDLAQEHGDYGAMIARLLGPSHRFSRYDVRAGELPAFGTDCDAYVVSGSAAGVNDGLAWVDALAAFLRSVRGRVRLIGICFGHQAIAHAFGGTIVKAPQGWGLGLTRYDLAVPVAGLDTGVVAMASHQDQVTQSPAGAQVLASNDFTPYAALAYARGEAMTLQFHPEFDADYGRALIAAHAAPDIGDALRAAAASSLDAPSDNAAIGAWLDRYLATGSAT